MESLLPKNVPTPEEVRANKKREEAQKVGIGQAFKDVVNADWLPMWAFRQLDAGSVGYYDPDFTVTDPRYWPKLTEGLDPAYYEMFGEATNINMAMKIRQQALSIQESNRNIASLGGTGVAVRIVGNVFDPVNILLGMATGGGGFLAKNASRAERFIRGGAFGAAIAAPTEAYRTARDPLQDTDDYMLNMGLAFGLGGIINSIPRAVRAEQAVRAGTATVEETPTSFIIRQKQLTEAPPRTPEPGLVVWQRPMQARDFINRGENPTKWNDVVVPKMKNFDWRPDVADEATRFGQAVPMRSTGATPTLARRQPLALPESANVPDSAQAGQSLAPSSTVGPVGVQAGDGAGGPGTIGGNGNQPQRPQLPTPRQASRSEYTRADAQRRLAIAIASNPAVEADNIAGVNDMNVDRYASGQSEASFVFRSRKGWNEFKRLADGDPELMRLVSFDDSRATSNQAVIGASIGKGSDAEDFIGSLKGGFDEFIEIAKRTAGSRSRYEDLAQKNLSVDPASRFYFWFRDNYPVTERRRPELPDFDTWNQQKMLGKGRGAYKKLDTEQRKRLYQLAVEERTRSRSQVSSGSEIKKEIIDSPATALPDGTVLKIHGQPFEVVQNEYGELTLVQRGPDGTELAGGELTVELAALDELPIDAGTLRTIRDPALPATPKYPSVDEMIAEVDRTGIDPYADVIVDPAKGTYEPIPDNVPIDPDTGEPMIDAVLAPENLDEVKFGDTPTEIPDPRTLEERLTSKIDEINRRRKNSPGIPRGDNTGGTILFAEIVDLVHELALRAVRAGVRGVDNLGKLFDELVAGKDPEIQKLRKDIIAQADDYVNEPELIEAKHRIARQRAEKADEIRGAKSTAKTTAKKSETSGNTPPPPVETPPGVGGTPKGPGDFDLTGREYKGDQMPGPSLGNVRFSMGKALEKSSSRFINWLGEVTGERVLFKQGFTDEAKLRAQPNIGQSASEATDRMFKSTIANLRKETLGIWDQYAKRENLSFIEKVIRDRFVDDFNDKIGIAIRAGRSDDPLIDAARKQYVKHFNDLREFGVKYGLPGFDKMPPDETYLWRVWDTSKIAKVRDLHGNEAIVDLLTEAAIGRNTELNRDATREVMNYFLDAINDHQYGLDLDKNLAFTSARSDIQDVISALKLDANKGADLLNRAKGRMVIDENASITTKAGKLSVSDLLDNNAETIAHVYARNIIGAGHMQEVFRAAEPFFGQKIDSLGKLVELASRDGANANVPPETLRYQVKKIEAISNSILGHRTAAPGYWTKAAIAIRGVNYLARAGKFAIAQIPEIGMVIANKGVQAAINNMPAMKDIAKNIFNGKFETRTAQEIQAIWALGTEPMVNHPVKRFDFREAGDQFLNYSQAARQLNKAQYWLSNISGMTYIQNVQQMWAGVTAINTWANMKTLPSLARLKSQGLDEVWGQKIIDNIRQHSTTETGPLGIRVKELNIHKWDKDVASKFIVANDKWSRKAAQQNNIALYSEWMTSDTGKVLTQFRSFAIQAYEKQFLQNGQILIASRGKDFQAWMEFILPCVMGGLAYYAQTHMSSIGRADREKYLDEMLDPQKVGLAAFNRGGASSILPMGTDFVADRLGFKKPFSYARSSGLESDPLLGNPTFDALVNVNARLFRSAIDPNYSSTQSDLRDLRKIIPGQNLPVIDNILNYYQSRMPKKRTENSNPW